MRTNSICFVGSDIYPVLNKKFGIGYIGGESVQLTLLAKAFNTLGWRVTVVDRDYGQKDGEVIDEIIIQKTFRQKAGLPILRFIYPRLYSIYKSLERANADIYYQSCAGMMTGVVAFFCRAHKKTFIYRTAHDTDCIPGRQLIKFWRDKKLYDYGLKRADLITVQGVNQKILLKKNYGLNGIPVNMIVEIPREDELNKERIIDGLWVNNLRPFKRPELFIKLAKGLPDYRFVMIGGPCPGMEEYFEKISYEAKNVPNINFLGSVPYGKVNSYFSSAKVFINTSDSEGFPNSFLQAWIRGTPVISFFDPDGIIVKNNLGYSPVNFDEMVMITNKLCNRPTCVDEIGNRSIAFAKSYYSPESVANIYMTLFKQMNSKIS